MIRNVLAHLRLPVQMTLAPLYLWGVFGARGEFSAAAMQQAHHDLGVDEVFGAAERDKTYLGPGGCGLVGSFAGSLRFERGRKAHKLPF